jgi:flagellar protein FlaG
MTEPVSAIARAAGLENSSRNNYHVFGQKQTHGELTQPIAASQKVSIDRIVDALRSYVESNKTSLNISINEATGDIVVKVISDADGKVIREIPSEDVLQLAAKMEQLEGLMFDEIV